MKSSLKVKNKLSSLGYNSFYNSENYHIINHKGANNSHVMSVELNDQSIKPFKNQILRTVGFDQYSKRDPINKRELKNKTPNPRRFEVQEFLP
jgi:hypothetical protein